MSYMIDVFTGQLSLAAQKWSNKQYPNIAAELTAIATALDSDPTTHDLTITLPPAAVRPGSGQTYFTNECLLIVNKGKGGNLSPTDMSDAITAALGSILPPANTTAPAVTGTGVVGNVLSCTQGTWTNAPTLYEYQWLRGGLQIAGAINASYLLVALDSGANVSCRVTATTGGGSASATSNAIAVA